MRQGFPQQHSAPSDGCVGTNQSYDSSRSKGKIQIPGQVQNVINNYFVLYCIIFHLKTSTAGLHLFFTDNV